MTRSIEDVKLSALMATVGQMAGRSLTSLSGPQLKTLVEAGFDISHEACAERLRRESAPRGRAQLRLAARDGELTAAGRAIVRARKASRARWSA